MIKLSQSIVAFLSTFKRTAAVLWIAVVCFLWKGSLTLQGRFLGWVRGCRGDHWSSADHCPCWCKTNVQCTPLRWRCFYCRGGSLALPLTQRWDNEKHGNKSVAFLHARNPSTMLRMVPLPLAREVLGGAPEILGGFHVMFYRRGGRGWNPSPTNVPTYGRGGSLRPPANATLG